MMAILCCFPRRTIIEGEDGYEKSGGVPFDADEKLRKSDSSSVSVSYDIFDNEGTDYQKDLWRIALSQKRQTMASAISKMKSPLPANMTGLLSQSEAEATSAEHCLQLLTSYYDQNKFAQKIPRISQIFARIEPFTAIVSSMTQSNICSALVWGSLTLVFQSLLQFGSLWEQMSDMIEDLSKSLPRLHAYHQLLETPRLHSALREVYQMLLDFCSNVIKCLKGAYIVTFFRMQWPSFSAELKESIKRLDKAKTEFEKEAQLAEVQKQSKRHEEVMTAFRSNEKVTNMILPRNERFTGRDGVLEELHHILEPSFQGDLDGQTACSCLIHATAGMGKTETAVEYAYRFRGCYHYIFWLQAQTEEVLINSLLEVASILGLGKEADLATSGKIQICLNWLRTTDKTWLLVYDNAEDVASIRRFWPASTRGAIIVTSQNPTLSVITKNQIELEPMTDEEGSSLIKNFLQRSNFEEEDARLLSEHLGGLPLAITHFSGAILRSQCPISQISSSFLKRAQSSRVWTMDDTASIARGYQHTLNTVWDLAIRRLPEDSLRILEFSAFLNPDRIPVDLFTGGLQAADAKPGGGNDTRAKTTWNYWDVDRFNHAIAPLCERHLAERYQLEGSLDALRTHRALQRSLLQRLDNDIGNRNTIFNEVVSMVRRALPNPNLVKRGDESQMGPFTKYSPQAVALHQNFIQSESSMPHTLEFATVLHDAAFYSHHGLGQLSAPFSLLQTAKAICTSLLDSKQESSKETKEMLMHVLSSMGPISWRFGKDGHAESFQRLSQVVNILEEERGGADPDDWTDEQRFLFARAQDDFGWHYMETNEIGKAKECFESSIEQFRVLGQEPTLTLAICDRIMPLSVQQEKERTREDAAKVLPKIISMCGENSQLSLAMMALVARAYFTIGDLDDSLRMHSDVMDRRMKVFGEADPVTLGSRYCLAVCLQHKEEFEDAEMNLRRIIEVGRLSIGWRQEDITRIKFRLSVVLAAQNRQKEARTLRAECNQSLESLVGAAAAGAGLEEATDESVMALLDAAVTMIHGRTAGIWSNGVRW
ncbi:pfs domain-containing protein [Bombardia bombarda]|uniref:Pfs domain-containing protein n=1 Tax=Bombardia bombarda TaxID=252184 RepID=A0AA39X869_9PEZI|nr:pfs domain-containing protein [Bombardia bombarda]